MKPPPFNPAALAPEVLAEWIATRREILAREGQAVKGGEERGAPVLLVKSLVTNEWCVLELPERARAVVSATARDALLAALTGKAGA